MDCCVVKGKMEIGDGMGGGFYVRLILVSGDHEQP